MFQDTICAPATAPVNSSIAIIRISGPESYRTACSFFSAPEKITNRFAAYGSISENGLIIDDVILIYYKAPMSFTGEDMVEIFCHGNPLVVSKILMLLNRCSIRMAEPGEFSKRAFLNGKMDLTQAEAINSLINARSDWEVEASLSQMHGSLKRTVADLREFVMILKADIEAGIDFIDQDIEFVSYSSAVETLKGIKNSINDIYSRCRTGERVSRGIDVILAGRPNVGKSSLLNLILNEERAIVSDIPGTTRDLIRETLQIEGVRINLTDTAGLGSPEDEIERQGVERSIKSISEASLVLVVVDAFEGITDEDRAIIDSLEKSRKIFILNKIDKVEKGTVEKIIQESGLDFIKVSAKTGSGFKALEKAIGEMIFKEFAGFKNSFIADARIISILEKARMGVEEVMTLLSREELPEIIAFELSELMDTLSGITGEVSADDVLGSIFSRFCIGK
ncbi:MAG: tRNA uridine-5-carboxymethylaminomethyl(34) synthesis GTPase MnmE [Spirochaetota bacterium]